MRTPVPTAFVPMIERPQMRHHRVVPLDELLRELTRSTCTDLNANNQVTVLVTSILWNSGNRNNNPVNSFGAPERCRPNRAILASSSPTSLLDWRLARAVS